ncbi:MAG: hypothetical protein HZB80_01780 [Deltaproteobacteria bacterium]|nr:hypothetical protein [Deltaproteobacteria bacterium]
MFELDKDQYSTKEMLKTIAAWKGSYKELMQNIADNFPYYGRCEFRTIDETWEVATSGWSGCEDIISALRDNTLFWMICWRLSKRGGYYEFETI